MPKRSPSVYDRKVVLKQAILHRAPLNKLSVLVASLGFLGGVSLAAPVAASALSPSSISCPLTTQCTTVDNLGREVTFNPQSPGSPTAVTVASGNYLDSVFCLSATQCTAVGGGAEVTFDPTSPGSPTPVTVDNGNYLTSVFCLSATQCTAVDNVGGEVNFNPTSPGSPTPVTVDNGNNYLTSVSCSSATQCTAVNSVGGEVTFDPASPSSPTPVTINSNAYGFASVSCPSATQCTAIDGAAVNGAGEEVTFDPTSPGSPTSTAIDNNTYGLSSISCPSATQCTAIDYNGKEVTFNPQSPGSPTPVIIDGSGVPTVAGVTVTSVAQTSATLNGTTNPEVTMPDGHNLAGYAFSYVARESGLSCTATFNDPNAAIIYVNGTFPGSDTTVATSPVNVSANLTGLTLNTPYCAMLGTYNDSNFASTAIMGFSTLASTPAPTPTPTPPVTVTVAPKNTGLPTIKGKDKVKAKLTASQGTWIGTAPITYKYRWESCDLKTKKGKKGKKGKKVLQCVAIKGATKATLTLSKKNVGHRIEVVVTATNAAGFASAASKPTAVVKK